MRGGYYHHLLSLLLNHHHRRAIQQVHSQLIVTTVHPPVRTQNPITVWNALLRQYSLGDFPDEAFLVYKHLQNQSHYRPVSFDSFAYSFLIKACANSQQPITGAQLHGLTTKSGFSTHVYVQTALVNMYVTCGCLVEAKYVFDEMPDRNSVTWNVLITGLLKLGELKLARGLFNSMPVKNVVSWTGLIDGYTRMNQTSEALSLFRTMMHEGVRPTELTMLSIFPAVWNIGCLELCQSVHAYGEKSGLKELDIRVINCLIDAYSKCGNVDSALRVFEDICDKGRNLVSWTSIISAFAMHGMAKEALDIFRRMENECVTPNRVTFLSILNACSHGGLVEEGFEFFRRMVDECDVVPDVKHYGCLVDMLGREGRLEEAEKTALDIPSDMASVVIWRTLLGACSFHGNAEMGERVSRKIMVMEKGYGGDYVLLSNIFAGVGRYADSEKVRRVMDERDAPKVIGLSVV